MNVGADADAHLEIDLVWELAQKEVGIDILRLDQARSYNSRL